MCVLLRLSHCIVFMLFVIGTASVSISLVSPLEIIVNKTAIFQCSSENTNGVQFKIGGNICSVSLVGSLCTNCSFARETVCSDSKTFRFSVTPIRPWHNENASCTGPFGGIPENFITLNITVPVTSVTLTPAQINVDVDKKINLTCQTDFCNPSARITWKKSSSDIISQVTSRTVTNKTNGLMSTISVFEYTGVKGDNGKQIYCAANNTKDQKVESTRHRLDVKFPPSADPVIISLPQGNIYESGTQVNLTCQLSGGNPVANLSWICKDFNIMGTTKSNSTTAISIVSFVVDSSFNKKICTCKASHQLLPSIKSTSVNFNIKVPVTSVTLTPAQINVDVDKKINLTCQTDFCNPSARITWKKSSNDIISQVTSRTVTNKTNGLMSTVSVFEYTGVKGDNGKQIYCTANNTEDQKVESTRYTLDVRYPPSSKPYITASPPGFRYDNGTNVRFSCALSDGNPLPTLSLKCKDMVGTNLSNSTTAVSMLSLVMNRSYNQELCNCTGRHQLLASSLSDQRQLTVFYNNIIISEWQREYVIDEHGMLRLWCDVDGNPLSNITWLFKTNTILQEVYNVTKSSYKKDSVHCLDHGNYDVIANNGKGSAARKTTFVKVRCKPRLYNIGSETQDKIGLRDNESLRINVRILLYPSANVTKWTFSKTENDSKVIQNNDDYSVDVTYSEIEQNVTLFKERVNTGEFGIYTLFIQNAVGTLTSMYHVDSTRPPLVPTNITLVCDNPSSIELSWISNFNGGDKQTFRISYSTDGASTVLNQDPKAEKDDEGYGKLHKYSPKIKLEGPLSFTITAYNRFGNSTSEAIHCYVVEKDKESTSNLPVIAGGAIGGIVFAALVILGIVFIYRRINEKEGKKNYERKTILKEERENDEDDGLKENVLYISAGPTDNEKPGVSGTAVYAEVTKRGSSSDNNANVYAEVQKSGTKSKNKVTLYSDTTKPNKGFLKKEGKPKQKKAKKIKQNKEVTDVYENPEDIVMTQNLDNVYSNTAASNGKKSEKHGYKNQDGLLYVEVQFDQKQDSRKPVIHGEDEKTDYAMVEFPFPPSSNNDKPTDEK